MKPYFRYLGILLAAALLLLTYAACSPAGYTDTPGGSQNPTSKPAAPQSGLPAAPDGAEQCGKDSEPGTWHCDTEGRMITFKGVPDNASPYRVPISPENRDRYQSSKTNGFERVITIAADIRFYDETKHLVPDFSQRVTLILQFTEEDLKRVQEAGYDKNSLAPIIMDDQKSSWHFFEDWAWLESPEQNPNGSAEIHFTHWGDPPIGWGAPRRVS